MAEFSFPLLGKIPAKKNRYRPKRKGFYKDRTLQLELDRLGQQIPAEVRDLGLIHPSICLQFYKPRNAGRFDKDNADVTIMDLLVQYGVLPDDSTKWADGTKTVLPSIPSDEWKTVITLVESEHGRLGKAEMERRRFEQMKRTAKRKRSAR